MDLITMKLGMVVLGLVGLAVWQLSDVNRELGKQDAPDTASATEATDSDNAGRSRLTSARSAVKRSGEG